MAAGLGFRRSGRDRGGRWQRAQTWHARGRHPAVKRLGRVGRLPTHAVAALPDAVGDAEAATLPVAGLTALHALRQGGGAGRVSRVPINAIVGLFCQLWQSPPPETAAVHCNSCGRPSSHLSAPASAPLPSSLRRWVPAYPGMTVMKRL
jgi:hypothetical protein